MTDPSGVDAIKLAITTLAGIMSSPGVEVWSAGTSAWLPVAGALCNIRAKTLDYDDTRGQDVEIIDGTLTAPTDSQAIARDDRLRIGGSDGDEYRAIERLSSVAQQQWRIERRVYVTTAPDRGRAT